MTGYIPMLLRPKGGERAAVIGLGTGMTTHAVAAFPIKAVEVLEIEPAMKQATTYFNDKVVVGAGQRQGPRESESAGDSHRRPQLHPGDS
jgi:spermidine synthase